MIFALAGNQNCGKTTLFNQLTGSNQHVGNFPGVTVDQKVGEIRGQKNCSVVDLPGIYSIRAYTSEEIVTRDFILNEHPDGIINIVDATNIERNLYLTLQLMEMHIPMVLALNMMDEVRANGGSVDIRKMSEELGIPVVPISAVKNEGIAELVETAVNTAKKKQYPAVTDFCAPGPVHRCIHAVIHEISDHAEHAGLPARFAATKLIENDSSVIEKLELTENERELIEHSIVQMEEEHGMDRNAALADMRYGFIESVCRHCVIKCEESREYRRSIKIDNVLTSKYFAIPIFVAALLLVFWLTFNVIGAYLRDLLVLGISGLTNAADAALTAYGINPMVHSLVIDGVFAGVGSVLSFLPIIVVLFFFLSIFEDTGYMARIAFRDGQTSAKDRTFRAQHRPAAHRIWLFRACDHGDPDAHVRPRQKNDDHAHPVYELFGKDPDLCGLSLQPFFSQYSWLVMFGLYFGGIFVGIIAALIMDKTAFRGKPVPFVLELPNYRFPSVKSVVLLMWSKAKDFLERAFTIIFIATIIIWFLQTFDARLNVVTSSGNSLLAAIGQLIAPVFSPAWFRRLEDRDRFDHRTDRERIRHQHTRRSARKLGRSGLRAAFPFFSGHRYKFSDVYTFVYAVRRGDRRGAAGAWQQCSDCGGSYHAVRYRMGRGIYRIQLLQNDHVRGI